MLFYTEESYGDFWAALVTLFGSALGAFDLNLLDNTNKGKLTGEVYIISFVILCNILILNLLIAILSSTYAMLENKKLVLYINEILKLRSSLEYNERASGLISAFPPWNIFPLLLSPLYFVKKDTRKLNTVVCHVCYVPVMLTITICFVIYNLLLLPITYLKGVLVKLQLLFSRKVETSFSHRVFKLAVFIFIGLIIVLLNFCVDLYMFLVHLYQANISFRKEKSKVQSISTKTYNQLQAKFEQDTRSRVEAVPFIEMSIYARSLMNVIPMLRNVIFCKASYSFEHELFMLQEYSKVKNALHAGSVRHGSQLYVFPMLWKYLLKELKVNSKIREVINYSANDKLGSKVSKDANNSDEDSQKDYLKQVL